MCETQALKQRSIVLDTAALIAGTDSLFALGGIVDPSNKEHICPPDPNEQVTFYTTPDVVQEVRDKRARMRLTVLQGVLVIRPPSSEALAAVSSFAKATGDYHVLSLTDLRVMALCWMLEVERDGGTCIRKEPESKTPANFHTGQLIPFAELDRMEREAAETEAAACEADDGWTSVQKRPNRQLRKPRRPAKSKRPQSVIPEQSSCVEQNATDGDWPMFEERKSDLREKAYKQDGSDPTIASLTIEENADLECKSEECEQVTVLRKDSSDTVTAMQTSTRNFVAGNTDVTGHDDAEQYSTSQIAFADTSGEDIQCLRSFDGDGISTGLSSLTLRDNDYIAGDASQESSCKQNIFCDKLVENASEDHNCEPTSESDQPFSQPRNDPILGDDGSVEHDAGDVNRSITDVKWDSVPSPCISGLPQESDGPVQTEKVISQGEHNDVKSVYLFDSHYASDDESGWINPNNVEEHLVQHSKAGPSSSENDPRVGCVTTDFAMQNTMLQMGLKILTVDGRRAIQKIKRFALRCSACGTVTRELGTKFCDSCGNAALLRVSFNVNKKGVARIYINPKKTLNTRGTKYPIPKPRGGRHNNDLILRADQVDMARQKRIEKRLERQNVDVLDPTTFYNAGAKFSPHSKPVVVGYGRRNPNEVRRSTRKKR